jgi:molecular chaperone Hsp33
MSTVRDLQTEHAPDEQLTGFHLPEYGVRGAILSAGEGVPAMVARDGHPPDVQRLLGELLAAGPLMAANLKFRGRMGLQIQNSAELALLLVQTEDDLRTRGMARVRSDAGGAGDFAQLTRNGVFAVTLEPQSGQSYQAMVPLDSPSCAQALEAYFAQSEQLPTRFVLASDGERVAGLMLQRLPAGGLEADAGWAHVEALVNTLGGDELIAQPPAVILKRLFHAEDLELHPPRPVAIACSCSQAKVSRVLLSLGEDEVRDILAEQGAVTVHCDFCGQGYVYDGAQVQALFAAENAGAEARSPGELH